MAHILVTSGPTRQYLDPVRFISNASSGRMGAAVVDAALALGHQVTVVSGPVNLEYSREAEVRQVVTTEEMLEVCQAVFPHCDGVIGVAAPCDYRPVEVSPHKIKKNGEPLTLVLEQTPDIVATLGATKRNDQWVVGFALETEDAHFRAVTKLHKKCCDLVVLNGPSAMNADENSVELINPAGDIVATFSGPKTELCRSLFGEFERRLIRPVQRS